MARNTILEGPGCGDTVEAENTKGVTCGEMMVAIADPMAKLASVNDYLADGKADKPLTRRQIKKIKRLFPWLKFKRA